MQYGLGEIVYCGELLVNDGGIPNVAADAVLATPGRENFEWNDAGLNRGRQAMSRSDPLRSDDMFIGGDGQLIIKLYWSHGRGDDFAECFAGYVHVALMQRPRQITISRDSKLVDCFRSCWGEPPCAKEQKLLEQSVRRASQPGELPQAISILAKASHVEQPMSVSAQMRIARRIKLDMYEDARCGCRNKRKRQTK